MRLTIRLTVLLLSLGLLGACTTPPDPDTTVSNTTPSSITDQADVSTDSTLGAEEILPDAIAERVQAMLIEEIGETLTQIGRYSRETWSDSCLGLGGPEESCLAVLTEGWQIEVIDMATDQRYFYHTDLNGDSIRRSTLDENLPPDESGILPNTIADRVQAMLIEEIGETSTQIGRYSRETWTDGCLGLGGPAESCLAALTDGWQVEVIDTATDQRYFYRTNLNGESIRRSTLEENLPPSVRDRIFQTVVDAGLANYEDLSVIAAEPRLWDGCYGLPPEDGVCIEVGILGWRAVVGDSNQSWVYHTDGNGTVIRLNDSESEG